MEQDFAPKPACFHQVPLWTECLLRRSLPSFLATRYASFHCHVPRGTGSVMPAGAAWGSRVSPSACSQGTECPDIFWNGVEVPKLQNMIVTFHSAVEQVPSAPLGDGLWPRGPACVSGTSLLQMTRGVVDQQPSSLALQGNLRTAVCVSQVPGVRVPAAAPAHSPTLDWGEASSPPPTRVFGKAPPLLSLPSNLSMMNPPGAKEAP